MEASTIVLIVTGLLGLVFFGIFLWLFFQSEQLTPSPPVPPVPPETGCVGPGIHPETPAPVFERISPKSTASQPLSNENPIFENVEHSVAKSYRVRSINTPVSPNHWIGNSMYLPGDSPFLVFPHYGYITDIGYTISMPIDGTLTTVCNNGLSDCPVGQADLNFDADGRYSIFISSLEELITAVDIVDVDALVSTLVFSTASQVTANSGTITIPIARGSPYTTMIVNNSGVSFRANFSFTLEVVDPSLIYVLRIDSQQGYLLVLSRPMQVTVLQSTAYIPRFTGIVRITYFNSDSYTTLLENYNIYPLESTIAPSVETDGAGQQMTWNIENSYIWTTRSMFEEVGGELLMASLPHHQINNVTSTSPQLSHPLLGPYLLVTTSDSRWNQSSTLPSIGFEYPAIEPVPEFLTAWTNDVSNLLAVQPMNLNTFDWCKWLNSLAVLALFGRTYQQNIGELVNMLSTQLGRLFTNQGLVNTNNDVVYDTTWNGLISRAGILICNGDAQGGNSFYQTHIGQFGYLLFAMAATAFLSPTFLSANNRQIMLQFARTLVNPYDQDQFYPLWRNKDWYTGYSLGSGLQPGQAEGKITTNVGSIIMGYYGAYLAGVITENEELRNWAAVMLESELRSLQYYFQFSSNPGLEVDPAFVQGTITNRATSFYEYTANNGNLRYPARNASAMIAMAKPMLLFSSQYINNVWTSGLVTFLNEALADPEIQNESFGYGAALLSMHTGDIQPLLEALAARSVNALPFGSTWSSLVYFVMSQ